MSPVWRLYAAGIMCLSITFRTSAVKVSGSFARDIPELSPAFAGAIFQRLETYLQTLAHDSPKTEINSGVAARFSALTMRHPPSRAWHGRSPLSRPRTAFRRLCFSSPAPRDGSKQTVQPSGPAQALSSCSATGESIPRDKELPGRTREGRSIAVSVGETERLHRSRRRLACCRSLSSGPGQGLVRPAASMSGGQGL